LHMINWKPPVGWDENVVPSPMPTCQTSRIHPRAEVSRRVLLVSWPIIDVSGDIIGSAHNFVSAIVKDLVNLRDQPHPSHLAKLTRGQFWERTRPEGSKLCIQAGVGFLQHRPQNPPFISRYELPERCHCHSKKRSGGGGPHTHNIKYLYTDR